MVKKAVNSSDVALLANVSQSAVSRAFTPGASIAPATRARIMEAAEELGYRPNALARAVISGRSKLIAIVTPRIDNFFLAPATQLLSRELQSRGYSNLLFVADCGDAAEVVHRIMQYRVEGIVMEAVSLSSCQAREFANIGIPVILFNRCDPSMPSSSSVVSDNHEGGRLIAEYFLNAGHKRIAFIAGDENSSTSRDREAGFVAGLQAHNVNIVAREVGDFTSEGGAIATRKLFSGTDHPDAVFVANDCMAFAAMDVIRQELHLAIPEQVSVIGFDDTEPASWLSYDLTTVTQGLELMVEATVDTLVEQIESESQEPASVVFPVKLNVRGSARKPVT